MKRKDLKLLWNFTLRTGMHTVKENKDTISAFLIGYEIGRDGVCNFTLRLAESIEEEFKLKRGSTGWWGQIEYLANYLDSDWITVFKKQSLKVLTKEFDSTTRKEFIDSFKKRIKGKLLGMEYHFRRDWIVDWYGLIDFSADWFKEIWSDSALLLMRELEKELKLFGKIRQMKNEVTPSEKLKTIAAKLHQEINKSDNGFTTT